MTGTINPTYSSSGHDSPYGFARAITPADTDLPEGITRAIYIAGTGNVEVMMAGDDAIVTFSSMAARTIYRLRVKQIRAGTDAAGVVALW